MQAKVVSFELRVFHSHIAWRKKIRLRIYQGQKFRVTGSILPYDYEIARLPEFIVTRLITASILSISRETEESW